MRFALIVALTAQQPQAPAVSIGVAVPVAGAVVRVAGRDTVPLPAAMVVLHRVGPRSQGPVDSVRSDASGRFRMTFRPDSSTVFLVSARYRGIEYFAAPVSRDAAKPDLGIRVAVFDTSSITPLTITSRHFVVGTASPAGVRNVADLVLLQNAGTATRLAGDSLHPTWRLLLPSRAQGVELGETDFAADAIVQHADTLLLNASIPPGTREFTLTYRIPAGESRFEIPIDHDVASADLLSEEPRLIAKGGLRIGDTLTVVSRHFTKWSGSLQAGVPLVLEFPGSSHVAPWALPALIALLGAGLLAAGFAAHRRSVGVTVPSTQTPAPTAQTAVGLLVDRIAQLDAAHAGGANVVGDAAWQEYLAERARLKAELIALLPR